MEPSLQPKNLYKAGTSCFTCFYILCITSKSTGCGWVYCHRKGEVYSTTPSQLVGCSNVWNLLSFLFYTQKIRPSKDGRGWDYIAFVLPQ